MTQIITVFLLALVLQLVKIVERVISTLESVLVIQVTPVQTAIPTTAHMGNTATKIKSATMIFAVGMVHVSL